MNIKIKIASIDDLMSIQKLNQECLPIYYNIFDYIGFWSNGNNIILCAIDVDKNKTVGFLVASIELNENNKRNNHILTFGVDYEYRRNNIGSMLVNKLADIDSKLNSISLFVHVENISGIKFYQKNGFIKVKELNDYYQGTLKDAKSQNAFRMEKQLQKN
jgi:ribosomal protein S18 acetylase RimI-like enzyme